MDVRPTAPARLEQAVRRSPRLLRKRGPRSFCARQRRYSKFVSLQNSPHVLSTSFSSSPVPATALPCSLPQSSSATLNAVQHSSQNLPLHDQFSTSFSVLHVNIRGWRSHVDELSTYVELLDSKPSLIAVNETFLNRSVTVEFPGYVVAGRRDRFCSDTNAHVDMLRLGVAF